MANFEFRKFALIAPSRFIFFASLCLCVVVPARDGFHRRHGKAANPSRHRGSSRPRAFVPCGPVNAAVGSVCRQPEPTLRAPFAPTFCASSHTRHSTCARRCFGCVSGFSSDSALRTTTAAQTRPPCRRIPPTAWQGGQPIASSRFIASSCLRAFVPSCFVVPERGRRIRSAGSRSPPFALHLPRLLRLVSLLGTLLAHVVASAAFPDFLLTLRYGQRPLHKHGCLADGCHRPHGKAPTHRVIAVHRVIVPSCLVVRKEIFSVGAIASLRLPFRVFASSWSIPSRLRVCPFRVFVSSWFVVRGSWSRHRVLRAMPS